MAQHYHTIYMTIGPIELEIEVDYNVTPGWDGDYTDPGYPAEVEIEKATVCIAKPGNHFLGRQPEKQLEIAPEWMVDLIRANPEIHAELVSEASPEARAAALYDHERDMRRIAS